MEISPETTTKESLSQIHHKSYEVEGVNIDLNYRSLFPKKFIGPAEPNKLVVFLPGWATDANTKTAAVNGQAFAEEAISQTLVVDAKPDRIVDDSLYKEAQAISRLVKETGATNITISGYSEGGIRAIDLAVILQDDPIISVDGVILMESVGLYDQDSKKKFVGQFAATTTAAAINTMSSFFKKDFSTVGRGIAAGTEVASGAIKEGVRTRRPLQRIKSQVNEMMVQEERVAQLSIPVILIQGEKDPVSNPDKVVPGYKDMDHLTKDETTGQSYDTREKFLKENVFLNAPYVRMVTGRGGQHAMPVVNRAEQVAKDSLYLLKRYRRKK